MLVATSISPSGVGTIAMNSPETRNALSNEMLDALIAAFEEFRLDKCVRSIVLTSTHERVFCAGGDLREFAAGGSLVSKHMASSRFPELFKKIGTLGKPTICAANGHVLAGGLGLAISCDLIIADESAMFATPEINVGVFPFMIMALIYRNIGRKKTNELLMLGNRITALEAEKIGLVNRVANSDEFGDLVTSWAEQLASKSPLLMRLGKDAIWRQMDMALEDALEYQHHNLTLAFSTDDVQEGVRAFLEGRAPVWANA